MNRIYCEQKRKRTKRCLVWCSSAAAVFAVGLFFCISNPALAANLPLIGHIFEHMQDSFRFKGDYSQIGESLEDDNVARQLENAASIEEMEQISEYTQTSDGLTVTLSEIYCNNQAIYVTLQMKSEEPFPETLGFQCETTERYSFNPTEQIGIPAIDGKMIDEYTYAGVIRFDLNDAVTDMSEYEAAAQRAAAAGEEWMTDENWNHYVKKLDVPDEFTFELEIREIFGPLATPDAPDYGKTAEELEAMSDEDWSKFMKEWEAQNPEWADMHNEHMDAIFHGSWNFTLDVKKNVQDTQTVELLDMNELGVGIEKVVKDRFEITIYDTYTDGADCADYVPVMLDADGRLMESVDKMNTVTTYDRDVSHVDIFLISYDKWMDELKGDYLKEPDAKTKDGRTPKEFLLDECTYHAEVNFED